jgi:hypothetical protein
MSNQLTKETVLADILEISGAEEVLAKYNLPCLTCPFAKLEMSELKIGEVCKMYGIDDEKLVEELNKLRK